MGTLSGVIGDLFRDQAKGQMLLGPHGIIGEVSKSWGLVVSGWVGSRLVTP